MTFQSARAYTLGVAMIPPAVHPGGVLRTTLATPVTKYRPLAEPLLPEVSRGGSAPGKHGVPPVKDISCD